jgi:carboxylesterase type B
MTRCRLPQFQIWTTFIGEYFIKCGCRAMAQYAAANGATVYAYYFYYTGVPNYAKYGTGHATELPFVFQSPTSGK